MKKNIKPKLRQYLLRGKSITQLQALRIFGTSRLAVYINRLRADGMIIQTKMIHTPNDCYAKYFHEI